MKFYLKFRRITRDGERLQHDREKLGETVFQRRLTRLKKRLADLANWPNPDSILEEIIKNECPLMLIAQPEPKTVPRLVIQPTNAALILSNIHRPGKFQQ